MTDLAGHTKVVDESWPTGHCAGCGNGRSIEDPDFDYLPWSEAEARNHPGIEEVKMPALDYDPYQHRRRIALSRAQVAAILDLREDVHITGMEVKQDPMWLAVVVSSARFEPTAEDVEVRLTLGQTEPTSQGPRWYEEGYAYNGSNLMQNPRDPGWMEGWRAAIEWLEGESGAPEWVAEAMKTRLP